LFAQQLTPKQNLDKKKEFSIINSIEESEEESEESEEESGEEKSLLLVVKSLSKSTRNQPTSALLASNLNDDWSIIFVKMTRRSAKKLSS
jgi:hypothetical protein